MRRATSWRILGGALALTLALAGGRPASAQEHLSTAEALEALCRYAAPLPPSPDTTPAPTWVEARTARALTVYSLDARKGEVRVGGYDPIRQELTLLTPAVFEIIPGRYGLTLGDPPPALVLDVEPEAAAELRAALELGQVRARLLFTLAALTEPETALCARKGEAGQEQLRGRLLAARLWRTTPEAVVAEAMLPEGAWARRLGLRTDGPIERKPRVFVKQANPLDANLPAGALAPLARDLERLLLPCFLQALAAGGPEAAALTLEAWMENGEVRSTAINVDATGWKALAECATAQLRLLRWPEAPRRLRVRFTTYFDRQP